jgi:hypothetical protein
VSGWPTWLTNRNFTTSWIGGVLGTVTLGRGSDESAWQHDFMGASSEATAERGSGLYATERKTNPSSRYSSQHRVAAGASSIIELQLIAGTANDRIEASK